MGIPDDYSDHVPLMFDMLLLAFQTDQTRIATLMLAHEASNRPMPFLNIAEGHHQLSHHNNNPDAVNKVKTIDHWYVQQFARFLQRMNDVRDLDGQSLLHNSMILYGSGISDGNKHWHTNLPILLAGSGGGTLSPGRYVRSAQTPITNCYLSLADRMGCSLEALEIRPVESRELFESPLARDARAMKTQRGCRCDSFPHWQKPYGRIISEKRLVG
ncbi:MAG: DUF1552 domain-containing protein [Pirellulaceae bacterium]